MVAEEISAVDPGFATILLVNGLALMTLAWFGTEAEKRKVAAPGQHRCEGRVPRRLDGQRGRRRPAAPQISTHPGAPEGIGLTAEMTDGRIRAERPQVLAVQRRRVGHKGRERQRLHRQHGQEEGGKEG